MNVNNSTRLTTFTTELKKIRENWKISQDMTNELIKLFEKAEKKAHEI